jgi:hypothetical protein
MATPTVVAPTRTSSFVKDLDYSHRAVNSGRERLFLYLAWPDATSLDKNVKPGNDEGEDWKATFPDNSTKVADVKRRKVDQARWWANPLIPEVALETTNGDRPGWAVKKSPKTTHFLFVFDSAPKVAFLVEATSLIETFNRHLVEWTAKYHSFTKKSEKDGRTWYSDFVPVPIHTLLETLEPERDYLVLKLSQ